MPSSLKFAADMEARAVLELHLKEQRERESARKEVTLLREELRIESEGLALMRLERYHALNELRKEQEARAQGTGSAGELEKLLAESMRREEVCKEQLKSERKKVQQGLKGKARIEAQEEEREKEKRRLREDAKALEIELQQVKERVQQEDEKVRNRTRMLEAEFSREAQRAVALEVELQGLKEKVTQARETGSREVASIGVQLSNERERVAALEERERTKIAELSLAVEKEREKVLEVRRLGQIKTETLEDELRKLRERIAVTEASWALRLEAVQEQLKHERDKVIMLQTKLGCLVEMHRQSTTSLKMLLQQESDNVSGLKPDVGNVWEEIADTTVRSHPQESVRSISLRGANPQPHPPPSRSQNSRHVRLLSPLASPLHSPGREGGVRAGGVGSGLGGLRNLRALRVLSSQ